MRMLVLVFVVACGTSKDKPPTPHPEMIDTMRDLAERACACNNDKACVHDVRDEWDAQKRDLQQNGLTGADKQAFETELQRLRICGDAAGLTIWQ